MIIVLIIIGKCLDYYYYSFYFTGDTGDFLTRPRDICFLSMN